MILAYSSVRDMVEAYRLFKGFHQKKVITWNTMVTIGERLHTLSTSR